MEIITLDDDKTYREYTVTELEKLRLEAEIRRQLKSGRVSITKHSIFTSPADSRTGKKHNYL